MFRMRDEGYVRWWEVFCAFVPSGRCAQDGEAPITPGPEVPGSLAEAPMGLKKGRFSVLRLLSPVIHRRASLPFTILRIPTFRPLKVDYSETLRQLYLRTRASGFFGLPFDFVK